VRFDCIVGTIPHWCSIRLPLINRAANATTEAEAVPCSLILYSNIPLPEERLSSNPNLDNL